MENTTDSSTTSSAATPAIASGSDNGSAASSGAEAQLQSGSSCDNGPTNPCAGSAGRIPTMPATHASTALRPAMTSSGPMLMQKCNQNNSCAPTKKNQHNSDGCGPASAAATVAAVTSAATPATPEAKLGKMGSNTSAPPPQLALNNGTMGHHQSCNSNAVAAASSVASSSSPSPSNGGVAAASILSSTAAAKTTVSAGTTALSSSVASCIPSLPAQMAPINLNISTTTGGNFSVSVDPQITVESLKKIIAKKLKVAKDRICLLHREKELQDGTLREHNLMDGSKIILIPNVETGLLAQRPENTVMQALESLNDSQVNDFLSGKTPLNLSMRLGDHMMLIQLQLSTVNPVNSAAHSSSNCSSSSRTRSSHHHHHHHHRSSSSRSASTTSTATQTPGAGAVATPSHSHHHHHHHHHHHGAIPSSIASSTPIAVPAANAAAPANSHTAVRKLELDAATARTNNAEGSSSNIAHSSAQATNGGGSAMTLHSSASTKIASALGGSATSASFKNSDLTSFLSKRDYESLQNIVKSIAMAQPSRLVAAAAPSASAGTTVQSAPHAVSANQPAASSMVPAASSAFHATSASEAVLLEQSPIKSLSNLVSSPIKTTPIKNIPNISNSGTSSSSATNSVALGPLTTTAVGASTSSALPPAASSICQDPIAAKLTSCLCTRLNGGNAGGPPHASAKQCIETACVSQQQQQQLQSPSTQQQQPHHQLQPTRTSTAMTSNSNFKATPNHGTMQVLTPPVNAVAATSSAATSSSRSSSSLHKTAHNQIARKHRHHHHHHHHHHHYHHPAAAQSASAKVQPAVLTSTPTRGNSNDSGFNSGDDTLNTSTTQSPVQAKPATSAPAIAPPAVAAPLTATASGGAQQTAAAPVELDDSGIVSDSRTLAEASRNLTQTLRKLSKEVFTNKIDFSATEEAPRKSGSGAVIESMKNHGKGIYSGTFSGTLNPALQDRYGRPKRDISTVIHILNDLLSATPQYHRGARISFEAPSTSAAAAASVAAASGSPGTMHHSSRSKHMSSKHHHSSHPCVKCIKTHSSSSSSANVMNIASSGAASSSGSGAASSFCAYGECNGHYSSKTQSGKTYPCCQQPSASSSSTSVSSSSSVVAGSSHHSASYHHHHHHHQVVDERKVCQCRYRIHSETGEREREHTCQKCATEMDNMKTKSKLDQLRLVMQQRKQKREARKLKGAPYGARVVGATTTTAAAGVTEPGATTLTATNASLSTPISVATATTTPSEVSPNHIVEEVDTAA